MWMAVFRSTIIDGTLNEPEVTTLIDLILHKVPWFDTKSNQFRLLKELESFVFSVSSIKPYVLKNYIDFLSKSLAPQ